jgi:regulator of protease activity HflC (stomatin/prohibitin superfamily)
MNSDLIVLFASLGLFVVGNLVMNWGLNKNKNLPLIIGAWVTLSALSLLFAASEPPFSMRRFIITLSIIGGAAIALGAVMRLRLAIIAGAIWAVFWFLAIRGYTRAGWQGVLYLVLPAVILPSVVIYVVSRNLLPLRDTGQHPQALSAFLSCIAGTNRPYYIINDQEWGKEKVVSQPQMKGSAFGFLLTGPGVVFSRCDHAPVISDGVRFKGIKTPGVNFTHYGDSIPQAIDLREQLRAFTVEARTKDGIDIKVLAFTPFRIDSGQETPQLGAPFPFRQSAAFKAIHTAQLIEHKGKGQIDERMEGHLWDKLPSILGRRVLRDIISRYRFDDLSAPYQLDKDPRVEIASEFRSRLKQELKPCGIKLVGGGISNLLPAERSRREIFEQRIRRWQVRWVRYAMDKRSEGQRSRLRQIEKARAQAQVEAIQAISERLARLESTHAIISSEEICNLLIGVIQQMAVRPLVRRLLPEGITSSVEAMSDTSEDALGKLEG